MSALRVLITNAFLSGRSGSEIVTRDIALGLLRRGHAPVVYAHDLGPLAHELRSASIPVVDEIDAIAVAPDIIHGHHNPAVAAAIARFPGVPAIFVCHEFTAWPEAPPFFPSILRYVAVDRTCADRLSVASGIAPEHVVLHLNAVDLTRFTQQRALPERPKRALAYVKHTAHLDQIASACAARSIELDIAGTIAGKRVDVPEEVLPAYDIVFTSALSALEAMASGCATIVCDARGLAGMVTPESYERWRPLNFGVRTLTRRVTAAALIEEIDEYDAAAATEVTALVRRDADLAQLVDDYVELYRACIATGVEPRRDAHDRALAKHLETWRPRYDHVWPWMIDRAGMLDDLDAALDRPPHVRIGERVALGTGHPPAIEYVTGFSYVEDHGVWTEGERAIMVVRVEPRDGPVDIALLAGALVGDAHPALDVDVRANGIDVATWSFRHPHAADWRVVRALVAPSSRGAVVVELTIRAPRSPHQLGLGADMRRLGLSLHQLEVRAVSSEDAAS